MDIVAKHHSTTMNIDQSSDESYLFQLDAVLVVKPALSLPLSEFCSQQASSCLEKFGGFHKKCPGGILLGTNVICQTQCLATELDKQIKPTVNDRPYKAIWIRNITGHRGL